MPLEDFLPKPIDPAVPEALDLAECRRLISAAPRHGHLPGGGMIVSFGKQLQLALNEVTGATSKVVGAQNEALRFQREADSANSALRDANLALIAAREEMAKLKAQVSKSSDGAAALPPAASEASVPKKRGPKAKVVPMSPATEPKSASQ